MIRKIVSAILFAGGVLAAAAPAFAQTGTADDPWDCGATAGTVWCSLDEDGVFTVRGEGAMKNYGSRPWDGQRDLIKDIVFAGQVTTIGNHAFENFSNLTSVEIPNSVTSIGNYAFSRCTSLTSITLPNSVTSIGYNAFDRCEKLESIDIPSSMVSIGKSAFIFTALTSIEIPAGVTSIGSQAFVYCQSLESINVAANNTKYSSINGVLFNKKQDTLIQYPRGIKGEYAIPNTVTSIGNDAFSYSRSLTSIVIPSSVTSIGEYAFSGCDELTSVIIPNGVTSISRSTFLSCDGLMSVIIPSSVTSIGENAFSGCSGLLSIDIPNSVTSIGSNAFYGCVELKTIEIPSSVTSIGSSAFRNCTGLTSMEIPNGVKHIDMYTFEGCTNLASITIPSSVTTINVYAFNECVGLKSITNLNPVPQSIRTGSLIATFLDVDKSTACLYVPNASIALYEDATGWKDFDCIQAAPNASITPQTHKPQALPRYLSVSGRTLKIGLTEQGKVSIYTLTGRAVRTFDANIGVYTMHLKDLPRGTYIARAKSGAWKQSARMVVR